jgi:hypothetical protein
MNDNLTRKSAPRARWPLNGRPGTNGSLVDVVGQSGALATNYPSSHELLVMA